MTGPSGGCGIRSIVRGSDRVFLTHPGAATRFRRRPKKAHLRKAYIPQCGWNLAFPRDTIDSGGFTYNGATIA